MKTALMKIVSIALLALCLFFTCNFDSCGVPAQPGTPAGGFPVTTYISDSETQAGRVVSTFAFGVAVVVDF